MTVKESQVQGELLVLALASQINEVKGSVNVNVTKHELHILGISCRFGLHDQHREEAAREIDDLCDLCISTECNPPVIAAAAVQALQQVCCVKTPLETFDPPQAFT